VNIASALRRRARSKLDPRSFGYVDRGAWGENGGEAEGISNYLVVTEGWRRWSVLFTFYLYGITQPGWRSCALFSASNDRMTVLDKFSYEIPDLAGSRF